MQSWFKVIFKLRLEEFLAFILLVPMLFFMVIYYGEVGFRDSNVDRFLITGGVFLMFLGIIKLKDLKLLLNSVPLFMFWSVPLLLNSSPLLLKLLLNSSPLLMSASECLLIKRLFKNLTSAYVRDITSAYKNAKKTSPLLIKTSKKTSPLLINTSKNLTSAYVRANLRLYLCLC